MIAPYHPAKTTLSRGSSSGTGVPPVNGQLSVLPVPSVANPSPATLESILFAPPTAPPKTSNITIISDPVERQRQVDLLIDSANDLAHIAEDILRLALCLQANEVPETQALSRPAMFQLALAGVRLRLHNHLDNLGGAVITQPAPLCAPPSLCGDSSSSLPLSASTADNPSSVADPSDPPDPSELPPASPVCRTCGGPGHIDGHACPACNEPAHLCAPSCLCGDSSSSFPSSAPSADNHSLAGAPATR